MMLIKLHRRCLFTVTYLLICFIVATPFNYATFQLLYTSDGIPAGADEAFHTFSILKILDSNNPLLPYTQFPTIMQNSSNHYPSFFHSALAAITKMVNFNQASANTTIVIQIEKSFMFAVSLAGTAGYALFIRTLFFKAISNKITNNSGFFLVNSHYRLLHLVVSILAFTFFMFSATPVIQTFGDGTYPQIFAMWSIFPYYMYLLINRYWVSSAFMLSIIASTHNAAFLMSLSATIPYFTFLALQRFKDLKKNLIKFFLTFFVFAIPALLFFYIPILTSIITGPSEDSPGGLVEPWSNLNVIQQVKPVLYFGGIISAFLLVVLNYRTFGWFSGWVAIYFAVFTFSSLLGVRFGRELSLIFGLMIGICIGYILFVLLVSGRQWFILFRPISLKGVQVSSFKLILAVIICASTVPLWYLYFLDRFQPDPLFVKYFSDTIDEANRFFLSITNDSQNSLHSNSDKGVIVLLGHNPWLKVTTFGKFEVLDTQISALESTSGGGDRIINRDLNEIFLSPDTSVYCLYNKKIRCRFHIRLRYATWEIL